ncbi:MAG: metal-sensing transcriptional repressor [Candidatus Pacebacteria bacterium]|nr:metal-sensing transcriptional repressor [Candidatus Paceibacterota bacterium]
MAEKTLDNRINNIIGQLRGIKKLLADKDFDCSKTLIQLKAVKSASASLLDLYLQQNLQTCLNSSAKKDKELLKKLVSEIAK